MDKVHCAKWLDDLGLSCEDKLTLVELMIYTSCVPENRKRLEEDREFLINEITEKHLLE